MDLASTVQEGIVPGVCLHLDVGSDPIASL